MTAKTYGRRSGRLSCLALPLLLAAPASAQTGTDPSGTPPKAAPKRLSELRGITTTPAKEPAPAPEPKAEPGATAAGIFGDTSKFTKLGGWGSFGNSIGEFGFAKSMLIMMPPVQDELKLTDDQKKKLRDQQDDMRKKGEEFGKSMREKAGKDPFKASENLSMTARISQFTSMMGQFSTLARENEAGILKILKPAQRKRLNQISLQMEGISALTKPEIIEELGIFEDDEQSIRQILAQAQMMRMTTWVGSMMAMRPNRPDGEPDAKGATAPPADPKAKTPPKAAKKPDPADALPEADPKKARLEREKAAKNQFETMRDKTDQIQTRAVREISKVLSKAQIAKWEILLGPPFDPKKINSLGQPPRPGDRRPGQDPAAPTSPKPSEG